MVNVFAGVVARIALQKVTSDGWAWKQEASGIYSVKLTYRLIMSPSVGEPNQFLHSLWCKLVPNKIAAMGWLAWRNRLATRSNLAARGVQVGEAGSICASYGQAMESMAHFSSVWSFLLYEIVVYSGVVYNQRFK